MTGAAQASNARSLYMILGLGVCAVSIAAPVIKTIDAPAASIAAYRLLFASVPVLFLALLFRRAELRALSGADFRVIVLSGLCLAGHFATWIASLQFGTVASSVALVTTSPLFVAGFAFLVAGERTSRTALIAIAISLLGGLVIAAADIHAGGLEPRGDLLALAGAVFAAAYYALGRRVRTHVSLLLYIGVVYPVAAGALLGFAAATRQPVAGFSPSTYGFLLVLAVVPQLLGHSALNWSLRYLSAPSVAIAVLGEPILATALAALLLRELPGWQRVAGGVLILAGVYIALRDERMRFPIAGEAAV
jgi:drug/metabolite transporter (DMT)-like permease